MVETSGAVELNPGSVGFVFGPALAEGYCKFTVEGAKSNYRASGCVFEAGVGCISAVRAE